MKQLLFMIPATIIGTFGCFYTHPYLGVLIYYLFAVLRPQFIWQWSLPEFAWSFYVAVATMLATLAWKCGLLSFDGDNKEIRFNAGHYCMMAFSAWIVITYFTAYSKEAAYPYLIEYLKIFTMFVVAEYVVSSLRHLWLICITLTLTICYISYEINDIYFSKGYLYVYKLGYGGLDNNGAALMLAMGIPLCLYVWDGVRHWIRWAFLLFIPIIIHAVLTSYSRGAMLSLVITIPIYIIRSRRRVQLLIILMCIGATIPFLAGKEIRERFFTIQESEMDESANARRKSWSIAWQMVNERPVFGFGIRNSNLFTFAYGADMEGRTIHSQWLQIAADSGFPALILYLSTIICVFYCCRRVRKSIAERDDWDARKALIIANGCEASLLIFCVGGSFLSLENFELPYILFLLGAQLWAVCQATNSFTDTDSDSTVSLIDAPL